MHRINTCVDGSLIWVKTSWRRKDYVLQYDGEDVATFRFQRLFGSLATAQSAEGCWTFQQVGLMRRRTVVRECGDEREVAVFRNNWWTFGGTVELSTGERYRITPNFWMTALTIANEVGDPIVRHHWVRLLKSSRTVEIAPAARSLEELPWLVMLGWYLLIQRSRRGD